jgi:hypothetical protein
MRKRWKLWVAGIALGQLLVIGIDLALLWPTLSDAEHWADRVRMGITQQQRRELARYQWFSAGGMGHDWEGYKFSDGSQLSCYHNLSTDEITGVVVQPRAPVPPLTRLRRILARLIPALKE